MTNREWLNTLSSAELAAMILHYLPAMSKVSTQSDTYLELWLNTPHAYNDIIYHFMPDVAPSNTCVICGAEIQDDVMVCRACAHKFSHNGEL